VIDFNHLGKLFSIVLLLDEEGRIRYASDTFERYLPDVKPGAALLDVLEAVRPSTLTSWDTVRRHMDSLFLLRDREGRFAIRGQLLEQRHPDQRRYVFCGAPWLTWVNENRPDLALSIDDFAPQDSQLDQLFLMTIEKRMLGELESANAALEQARRETELAEAAKTQLFARMSHEMRTPLNGVASAIGLLADRSMDDESREIVRLAQTSATNLMQVINYALDFTRADAGNDALEQVSFSVGGVLNDVTDIVRARAVEKGLDLHWLVERDVDSHFLGDRQRIRQCLLNLLINAIKFTERGRVILRALPSPAAGQSLRFEVEDTGIGISREDRAKVFEPFWTTARGSDAGTGLGLDIVRGFVQRMGGRVGVSSTPGVGSQFWIDLPLEASPEQAASLAAPAAPTELHSRLRGRVLLVDDNEINRILGRKVLSTLGLQVEVCASGPEAIEHCERNHYDLVLMDVNMPGMDGVHATRRLRETFAPRALPIVALTAHASAYEEQRCLDAGMNHYLTKPVVRETLAEQLAHFLTAEPAAQTPAVTTIADGFCVATTCELDAQRITELSEQIGPDSLRDIVQRFEEDAVARQRRLRIALSEADRESAQLETHTLGSSCLGLGLTGAAKAYRDAEAAIAAGGTTAVSSIDSAEIGLILARGVEQLRSVVFDIP
jgi:signal transduction histidine kinase/DNA-binding NarL/FixJ family response regulator